MTNLRPFNRFGFWMVLAVSCTVMSGCGSPPVKRYYTLDNISKKPSTAAPKQLCGRALGVASAYVVPPYDLTKIVFRSDALEIRYYNHRHWVCSPEEMMTKLIARRIESTRLFASVDTAAHVTGPHLTLLVKLHNLEEVDQGGIWNGRLAMDLVLKDEMEEVTLWTYRFDVTRPSLKKEIKAVVRTINEIYNDEMDKAETSLASFLIRNGGCSSKPPSVPPESVEK